MHSDPCRATRNLILVLQLCVVLPLLASAERALANATELAGSIEATVNGKLLHFPSVASNIDVDLQGDLARVRVTQRFSNPLSEPVHARYLFPLNKDAAVFGLTMNVGNERISALIKEKVEAEKTFRQASEAGKAAVLMTQQRPNMFTQQIANLMPGLPIEVILEYTQALQKTDGAYELVVPLVVGPRFVPEPRLKVSPLQAELNSLPTQPPVFGLDVPDKVQTDRIGIEVTLASPVGFYSVTSATHKLDVLQQDASLITAKLKAGGAIPNRDFVLRYQLGSEGTVTAGVLGYADERGGFFSVLVEPPTAWIEDDVLPREVVFLLDCSGSMAGQPMAASKAFMREALANLRPRDSFRIIRFSDSATEFSRTPLPATTANIAAGLLYTEGLAGSGGTRMRSGIEQALMVPKAAGVVRNVVFLTDGYVGNEFEILGLVERELGKARLFALGVGSGVNRFLLDELARTGRGFARYLDPTKTLDESAAALADRLQTPLLTDLRIDWGDLQPTGVTPSRLPDLYAGDSLRVQGRYAAAGQYRVTLSGRSGGKRVSLPMDVTVPESLSGIDGADGEAIALVWARSAIKDAMHQLRVPQQLRMDELTDEQIRESVTNLGLSYSLLTQWTSFVAVSEQIYNPDAASTGELPIPAAKPAGTSFKAAATQNQIGAHGGYAAPEPGVWAGLLLLLLVLLRAGYPGRVTSERNGV